MKLCQRRLSYRNEVCNATSASSAIAGDPRGNWISQTSLCFPFFVICVVAKKNAKPRAKPCGRRKRVTQRQGMRHYSGPKLYHKVLGGTGLLWAGIYRLLV